MNLDGTLERMSSYLENIKYTDTIMSSTDDALGQAVDLVSQAYSLALGGIGAGADEEMREANALEIDQIIQQLMTLGNRQVMDAYIFAGMNVEEQPFQSVQGGVMFTGDLNSRQVRVSNDSLLNFGLNGRDTFGALSSRVQGTVDLDPDLSTDTLLSDLNGALNRGIRKGNIIISDGASTENINLSDCVTVGDVIDKINNNSTLVTAALSADGSGFQLTATGANVTVTEAGTGYAARDLGLYATVAAGAIAGQDIDARLTLNTDISLLASGAGIDLVSGLTITNSLVDDIGPIDLSSAQTLGDLISLLNNSGLGIRAEINADGTGINILNQLSGSEMSIGENGGTTAADLGVRTMNGNTVLSDMNAGQGVATSANGKAGVIRIIARDDTQYDIDLSSATTVQDVIDLINAATGAHITASLASTGNGITLTDTISGANNLRVTTVSDNGYFVAEQLGFVGSSASAASDTLTGADVNKVLPEGVFSNLIALAEALRMGGDQSERDAEISRVANALAGDRDRLSNYHGEVGAIVQTIESRREHMEDNILATETLRSDIRDIDFTEAITRYQNLVTALQGNLMTGGTINTLTLLDYL